MGYFSNGTEGAIYEETFCARCVHFDDEPGEDRPCPVWMAHLLFAYEETGSESNAETILNMLIPREEALGGLNGNGRCKVFVQDPKREPLPAWVEENVL